MTSRARRDPLGELARLARTPEPGANNLGEFLAINAGALVPMLGVSEAELRGTCDRLDEELVPELRALLARRRSREDHADRERRRCRSLAAAERLGATARWSEQGAALDVDLLFGELLADRGVKFISFRASGEFSTTVRRQVVADSARLRRVHLDLVARMDARGLCIRWKGGRGGYNWFGRPPPSGAQALVLTVPLRSRVAAPERRPGGAWLARVLQELGYAL